MKIKIILLIITILKLTKYPHSSRNFIIILGIISTNTVFSQSYHVVGTNQKKFYSSNHKIEIPQVGQDYYGQDPQFPGPTPTYKDNGNGTISDQITELMWVKERGPKMTWDDALAGASANRTGGYSDWRMPTIKELYSLIEFSGINGIDKTTSTGYIPFIDTKYFGFAYGSGIGNERVIDCQDWSATVYVSTTMRNDTTIFGVNFADGRIKGYPKFKPGSNGKVGHQLYVRYVRNNPEYGKNLFHDNSNGTITDLATNLMWSKDDSKKGMCWPDALAWVQAQNSANYLGYNDWRLPNIKELQSIVDYTSSPATTNSPAIDVRYFNSTLIKNEGGQPDYPYFWSGTVLIDGGPFPSGTYISFGRAMGYINGSWIDVHGAGSQKSDIMTGDPTQFPKGRGPQGDAVRISNYVRLVRNN